MRAPESLNLPAAPDPDARLRDEQLSLHTRAPRVAVTTTAVVTLVLAVMLREHLPPVAFAFWLLALGVALGLRVGVGRWHARRPERRDEALWRYRASFLVHGLVWAGAAALLPALHTEGAHDLLVLGVIALVSASVAGAWFDPASVLLFATPPLGATVAALLVSGRIEVAAMVVVYGVLALLGIRRALLGLVESLRLRQADVDRVHTLERLHEADRALAATHERLAQLEQRTAQGFLFTDVGTRVTQANPALADMLGRRAIDLPGRPLEALLDGEALQRLRATLDEAMRNGQARTELDVARREGGNLSVMVSASALGEPGAVASGVVSVWTDIGERRRAERELRTYQVVINSTADLTSVIDEQHRYRLVNEAWARASGIPVDQARGIPLLDVPQPEAREERLRAINECLALQQVRHVRSPVVLPGLGARIIDTTYYPYADGADQTRSVVLVSRDVTAETEALESLRRHEAEHRALLDAFPGYIARLDRDLVYTYANPSMAQLVGRDVDELIGCTVHEVSGPERAAEARELFGAVVHAGDTRRVERRHPGQDGRPPVDLQMHFAAGIDPASGQRAMYLFGLDISDRVRAEHALAQREAELSSLLESFPGHIGAVDQQGRYVYVNEAHARFLGRPSRDVVGRTLHEVLGPTEAQHVVGMAAGLDDGVARVSELHLEGDRRWPSADLQVTQLAGPLRPDGSRTYYWFGIDISALKRAEAGLRRSEAELRAVLEAFPGLIGTADQDHRFVYVNRRQAAGYGRTAADLIGRHLSEVMSPARYRALCALEPRLRDGEVVVTEVHVPANEGRAAMDLQITQLAGPEHADGRRMFYAFGIDVSAHKQAESALRVAVAEAERANRALSDLLAHLSRGQRTPTNAMPGFGHRLEADRPQRPDGLPHGRVRDTRPEPAPRAQAGRRQRVLYIEDNPVNAMLMEAMFESVPDIELHVAESALAGLDLVHTLQPDLVLTDIQMPDMDGFEVLRRLHAREATRTLPVIAVSANAMPDDVARSLAAGFCDYLTKPLELAALHRAVGRALGRDELPAD